MKKALLLIAAAMFVFAGCQKEASVKESKTNDVIHINVGQIAPATKVAAVDIDAAKLSFKFEEGDEVAFLNGNTLEITEFTCTNPATGEFEKTNGDALDPDGEYLVAYPVFAPDYLFISEGVYPQNYRANQIPKEHVILANGGEPVSGASTEFNLDYHFGIIHFKLKGNAKIGSIEYQCKDGEGEYDEVSTILSCGEGVQLSDTPTHFYMDVNSTSGSGFKLIFKDASGNELGKQESEFNLNANKGKMVDFDDPITVNASSLPDGALSGVFTVADDGQGNVKKVHFSKGNLYAKKTGDNWTWNFYDEQYKYNSLSTSTDRKAKNTDNEIDLFTWGYDNTSTNDSYSLNPVNTAGITAHTTTGDKQLVNNTDSGDDWSVAYCGSNGIAAGTWRTLSTEEWQYLFNTRTVNGGTQEGKSYQRAAINSDATSVYGMILYPDNYTSQTGATSYTSTQWTTMEENGCVFLPAAGCRYHSDVSYAGEFGSYWSSTAGDSDYVYRVYFESYEANPCYEGTRGDGYSVRLVTEYK